MNAVLFSQSCRAVRIVSGLVVAWFGQAWLSAQLPPVSDSSFSETEAIPLAVNEAPEITTQPASQNAEPGAEVSFTVTATGTPPPNYQWRFQGEPLTDGDRVAGATTDTLTLSEVDRENAGEYSVVVRNDSGTTTSAAAWLSINLAQPDPSFVGKDFSAVVATVVQPDGRLVLGGLSVQAGEEVREWYLERRNPDGSPDSTFHPRLNQVVRVLACQPDGKLVIGGDFTTVDGRPQKWLARLNADGTRDETFPEPVNGPVNALAVQADGRILVGGGFSGAGGLPRRYVARINPDGSVDPDFAPDPDGAVLSIASQPDGKILVGGHFDQVAARNRPRLARLWPDGQLDESFVPEINVSGFSRVAALVVEPDGQIVVGGRFESPDGESRQGLVRLNPDGSLDPGFTVGMDRDVEMLALQADGAILAGGDFSQVNGLPRSGVVRLDPSGAVDLYFSSGSFPYSLFLDSDGRILIGGWLDYLPAGPDGFGRLLNTGPVTNELSRTETTLIWRRGGTAPEVWRTVFEHSADGQNWTVLGEGTRVPGGWEWSDGAVPATGTIRARGWTTGGHYNASAGWTEAYWGAPVLLASPLSHTREFGAPTRFWVAAGGSAPLSFQWQRNGIPLTDDEQVQGAQTAELRLGSVTGADAGEYAVMVSNAAGSVTSAAATLTVMDPLITESPVSQTRGLGQSVTFHALAVGTEPLSYQWWHDEEELPGATEAVLELSPLQESDAGEYHAVVSNGYGSARSEPAMLTVVREPLILQQPVLQWVERGENAGFHVEAVGWEPLHYQWWKDEAPLPGATAPALELVAVQGGDAGRYSVTVSNQAGTTLSDEAVLLVNLAREDLAFHPEVGGTNTLEVDALAVLPDGLAVGGAFASLGGEPRPFFGWLDADGNVDPRQAAGMDFRVWTAAIQADGSLLVGGYRQQLPFSQYVRLRRVLPDGSLDEDFGLRINYDEAIGTVMPEPDGNILVAGTFLRLNGEPRYRVARLNPDGSLTPEFKARISWPGVECLALDTAGRILVGGRFGGIKDGEWKKQPYLGRLTPEGILDPTFAPALDLPVATLLVEPDGNILIGGSFTTVNGQQSVRRIARLKPDGSLDSSFRASVEGAGPSSLVLQADGKIIVGGYFESVNGLPLHNLARLNPDGTVDLTFAPSHPSKVYSLALQPDGQVLAGSDWITRIPGPFAVLRRFSNPTPATEELRYEGSRITWLRGGASPEARRVTFEHSIDGETWTLLGRPGRIAGGWELAGVSLPASGSIRARAYVASGLRNASTGLVESRLSLGPGTRVRIQAEAAGFGADGFGFPITGPAGQRVAVERSENLRDWVEVETLTLGAEPADFTDPDAPWDGQRYYRVRAVQ